MKMKWRIALIGVMTLAAAPVWSEVQRLALLVGTDRGLPEETPLKYAHRDAQQMAEVLGNSGTFDKDGIYILPNASLSEVRSTLEEIRERVKQISKSGNESLVLLYFSGHGDKGAVHISGQRLTIEEIRNYLGSLESGLKILIVDACESGDLLRQKGGQVVVETHHVEAQGKLEAHGTVILSSSAQGEEAQESELYKGSVFTHHLINGLEGMADINGDKQVSLWEMFNYARVSTQAEKILGQQGFQNPSFDFDVVGRADIPMAYLTKERSRLVLRGFSSKRLEIYTSGMELQNTLWLTGRQEVVLQLPSDDYVIAYDDGNQVELADANLSHSSEKVLTPKAFSAKPRALVYSKGGRAISDQGFQASIGDNNPAGDGPSMFGSVDYVYRSGAYKRILGFGYGAGAHVDQYNQINRTYYSASLGLERAVHREIRWQMLVGPQFKYFLVHQQDLNLELKQSPDLAKQNNLSLDGSSYTQILELALPIDFETEIGGPFPAWLSLSMSPVHEVWYRDFHLNWQSRTSFQPIIGFSVGRHLGF